MKKQIKNARMNIHRICFIIFNLISGQTVIPKKTSSWNRDGNRSGRPAGRVADRVAGRVKIHRQDSSFRS